MKVAVLLPSKGRAKQLEGTLLSLDHQLLTAEVSLLVIVAALENDLETVSTVKRIMAAGSNAPVEVHLVTRGPDSSAVDGWNWAYRYAYGLGAEWFVLGADDIDFWAGCIDIAVSEAQKTGSQVIGLNDTFTNIDKYAPHYMASRRFTRDHLGGLMAPPVYRAWWFDREVCEIAQEVSSYAPAWDAIAKHYHPDFTDTPMDETYQEAWPDHDRDKKVYLHRKAAGFPIDYDGVLGKVKRAENALHADEGEI